MQTGNPAFSDNILGHFDRSGSWGASTTLTAQGTAVKTFVLLALAMLTAAWSWDQVEGRAMTQGVMIGSLFGGFVLAMITTFKPTIAPWTAPLYAAVEGVFLGAISRIIDMRYPGIAIQAVGLTGAVTFVMLMLYTTRTIRVTNQLATGIVAATGGLELFYIVTMLLGMFGIHMPLIFSAGPVGIVFSLLVVGLAAFNLLLDFDQIERWSQNGVAKSMEWYCAFGLMVTLVWLYLELLRLLSKIQGSRN